MAAVLAAAGGVLLLLLAYGRVGSADFNWDDDAHITDNPVIVGPQGLKEIWTSAKANYFPLTMTSFWVQHALWGLAPGPYHWVTLLFHGLGALMLWHVLRQLAVPGAWLGAMLWALHPVQVESVAWICELKNTQSGFFYLVAIACFVHWLQRPAPLRFGGAYLLALMAALAAVLSKSSTVMLPVVLGLIGWWQGRRQWREALWLAPFFALSLAASAWTIWEQKVNSMASGADWSHGLASRLMLAGKVPWFYLGKLVWPEPLVFIYPRWDVNALGPAHWLPLVAAVVGAWILWRRRDTPMRPVFVGAAYFGISLFPVLGLFDVFFFRYSFVGDHFQYLASMGPLALLGAGLATLGRREKAVRFGPVAGPGALLLAACALLTWGQTRIYQTRETLWRDTVTLNPRAGIAQMNLGMELMGTGRPAEAIPHFQAALELKISEPLVRANWGSALIALGRAAEAVPQLDAAIRLMPGLADAHNSLGVAWGMLGDAPRAIAAYRKALEARPDYPVAWTNLARLLVQAGRAEEVPALPRRPPTAEANYWSGTALAFAGRHAEAIPLLAEAVRLKPDYHDAEVNLASALYHVGRVAEAIPHYAAAVRLRPDAAGGYNNLGSALLRAGRPDQAIEHYRQALQREPDYLDARCNLALALAATGQRDAAIRECEEVLRRKPDHPVAREQLQQLQRAAGGREASR